MVINENEITTISLTQGTKHRLEAIGNKSETYDELINRLLNERQQKEVGK